MNHINQKIESKNQELVLFNKYHFLESLLFIAFVKVVWLSKLEIQVKATELKPLKFATTTEFVDPAGFAALSETPSLHLLA